MESVRPSGKPRRHPLLFVHGAWHGAWCWERFLPWFAERGWECHALDLRGHGHSPNPVSRRRTRIRHYVADLAAAVETLDRPPIIVAHSMGGLVAQRYLEGKQLPGAVLLATVPLGGVWRATLRTVRRHPVKFLKVNLVFDLKPLVEDRGIAADLFLPAHTDPAEIENVWRRLQGESYLAYLEMLFVIRPRPPLVTTPVAIVAGSADRIFSVTEERRIANAYGADAVVVDGAAHDLMLGPRWEAAAEAVAGAAGKF